MSREAVERPPFLCAKSVAFLFKIEENNSILSDKTDKLSNSCAQTDPSAGNAAEGSVAKKEGVSVRGVL